MGPRLHNQENIVTPADFPEAGAGLGPGRPGGCRNALFALEGVLGFLGPIDLLGTFVGCLDRRHPNLHWSDDLDARSGGNNDVVVEYH